jgi:hypothetical protein
VALLITRSQLYLVGGGGSTEEEGEKKTTEFKQQTQQYRYKQTHLKWDSTLESSPLITI